MAFYQKYRPKTFSDLIGEDHIAKTLREAVKSGKLSHAYLLCGPRGTGKTTTARLLAKAFNCTALADGEPCNECDFCTEIVSGRAVDVIEIDAASHTKVDEIREIIDNVAISPTKAKKKVYIIDEVHMLSNSSFNALLKTLEEPPKHVVFILATTEPHKLPATILSRTQRYDFKRISKEDIAKNLKKIADAEGIKIEEDALGLIAISAEGVHRDAVGLLEQIAAVTNEIKKADVQNILGIAEEKEVYAFLGAIFNANTEEGLKIAHRLYADGTDMAQFNKETIDALRKILLTSLSEKPLFDDTDENKQKISKLAKTAGSKKLVQLIEIFISSSQALKESADPILPIEMGIVEASSLFGELPKVKEAAQTKAEEEPEKEPASQKKVFSAPPEVKAEESPEAPNKEDLPPESVTMERKNESGMVPVAVLQMTDDLWHKIVEATQKKNSALGALLRDAKPLEVTEDKLVLGVKFKFHQDRISDSKNCKLLEEAVAEITGAKNCVITCKISDTKVKPSAAFKNDEDLQKAAEEIFA